MKCTVLQWASYGAEEFQIMMEIVSEKVYNLYGNILELHAVVDVWRRKVF